MRKGFSLIELLAVIIILGVLAAVIIPRIQQTLTDSRNKAYNLTVERIKEKAYDYVTNKNLLSQITTSTPLDIYVQTLLDNGYITEGDLEDPRNKGSYIEAANSYVRFSTTNGTVNYEAYFQSSVPNS